VSPPPAGPGPGQQLDPPGGADARRPVRVLLVDDDALVRAALRMILSSAPDLEVVGEATDGSDVAEAVAAHHPDVVLMDIRMPRTNGIAATRRLRELPRAPQVIVLTTFQLDDYVFGALRAGASGFLLKDTPPTEIVQAVRTVADGQAMLSPAVTRTLIQRFNDDAASGRRDGAEAKVRALSDREREVAVAVGRGLSNSEIAAVLYMSEATVKAHVSRLLTKLGVANRVQVAIVAHDAGLV
jgi:DNA-binding NarL/FixJ family response regulator